MADSFNNSYNNSYNNCEQINHDIYSESFDNEEISNSIQNRMSSNSLSSINSNSISISNFSVSIDPDTSQMTNSKKKIRIKPQKKNKYFFCVGCNQFYILDFESNNCVKIDCNCYKIKDLTVDIFNQKYTTEKLEEVEKNSNCKIHNKQYKIYCIDCHKDLCEDCENETKKYNNIEIIIKKHETHSLIKLQDEIKAKIKELTPLLKKIKKDIPLGLIDARRILNLIINLIKNHSKYYSYNLYKSLDNALSFLLKFEAPKEAIFVKVETIIQLEENIKNQNPIISIIINNQKVSDLSLFRNLNAKFLTELNLDGNDIEDISPLTNCIFERLKTFSIEENKLNNNNAKFLKILKMPEVTWFNLYSNHFTTTEIIEAAENFPKIESYFVGNNKFDKKELDKNKIYTFPAGLREFGITGNLTQETSDFITKLKIEKIKTLYISRNKFTSLSFLENIKFENLKEIWPSFNEIKDWKEIKYIQSKETITKINFKANKISNIDDILEITKFFPSLKELILENNDIKPIDNNIINEFKEKNIILKI